MSIFDAVGGLSFSLDDAKVATWNSAGSYGTAVDVPSVQVLGGDPNFTEAMLEGDDAITAANSRMKSMQVQLQFGSLSLAALTVITGYENVQTAEYLAQKWGTLNAPYVGVCGRALEDGGNGDLHLFWPKAKITGISGVQMQQDQYIIPQVTLTALLDATYGFFQMLRHATAQAVAIPPSNAI